MLLVAMGDGAIGGGAHYAALFPIMLIWRAWWWDGRQEGRRDTGGTGSRGNKGAVEQLSSEITHLRSNTGAYS